ncbi:PAS domain-containing protein [Clostridium tetani]|nr:PAS domain-containing protein [Clostridium tetani]
MDKYIRLEITAVDRMGMTLKILDKIYELNINLTSVEVFPNKVYVKVENIHKNKISKLMKNIYSIDGIYSIKKVELLEHEKYHRKLLAVIDSVDEGIMYINKDLKVEVFNKYCENIFYYDKGYIEGKNLRTLIKDDSIIDLIKSGKNEENIKIKVDTGKGAKQYLTTITPVKDDEDNNIGVVSSIRDIKKVMEIANVFSSSHEGVFKEIIGNSEAIKKVKEMIKSVAKNNSTIMLRGESGTGKDLFAKAIHNLSVRSNKKLVTVNCAAIPPSLIESELFGYEKGSFTGASSSRDGLFKEAHEGTLILDEIGELPLLVQAKLLRVLQEGVIRKIGSNKEEKVDVRIICATNRNLEDMVKNKEFREDLYYRLNVIPVFIPPLRDRMEDIPILIKFFIDKLNKKLNKRIMGAELKFIEELLEYKWPGNIRELENVVERAMNLCSGDMLKKEHVMLNLSKTPAIIEEETQDKDLKLKDIIETVEKEAIIKSLKKNKSFRRTAKALGVSHTTIINKVNKYNIKWKE